MIVLITGASRGFGQQAVPLFLERGHTVIAAVRGGETRVATLFDETLLKTGRLHALDLHLDRPETFELARQFIGERFGGKLDVLINNAGYGLMGPLETQSPAQIRHQMEVNYFGPTLLTQCLIPALREAHRSQGTPAKIINVSSIAGLTAFPFYGAYNASKHALEGQSEALAYELRPFGIQVALIEPGGFKTEFITQMTYGQIDPSPTTELYQDRLEQFDRSIREKNVRFSGDPLQVARLMVRLAEKRRMPLRNIIGPDAKSMALLKKIMPERWRVPFMDWAFRRAIFKNK